MFELVVASGKGGTGKTSIVGALAELAKPAVLVDCDVDAANLHLIVKHHVLEEHDFSSSRRASIDMEKCAACCICVDNCRFNAININPDANAMFGVRFAVDPLACEGCGLCVHLCSTEAIEFEQVLSGRWYRSDSDYGPFLHARLGIAQSNSGRLVSLLRQQAREIAQASELNMIVVDGPPGISCPVIATLTNASYLLIVTEPSLSAIHDMERLVDLASHFRLKSGICINKYDINEEVSREIERFANERRLMIHCKIPYDPAFVQAQLQGQSYMQTGSADSIETIRKMWHSVQADAGNGDRAGKRRFAV